MARASRLRTLVATAVVLAGAPTSAHAAGWGTPVALPTSSGDYDDAFARLRFDAAGHGLALWSASGGATDVSRSADGGASWSAEPQPPGVPDRVEVGLDGAGNRIFAFKRGSFIRIVRTDAAGTPAATTFAEVQANARTVSLAVNPAGDALVAWTSDNTSDETGLVYWDHGQSAPVPRQLLPEVDGASNATPVAILDPNRAATVAYQQAGQLVQVSTADALATQFGSPTTISAAQVGGAVGAQAPDGRAAIAWYESRNIPANQYASTVRFDLHAAVRGPGGSFGAPQLVDGSDDVIAGYYAYNGIAVAPNGRAIIGYRTMRNRGVSLPCQSTQGESTTSVATARLTTEGTGAFAAQVLAGGGTDNGLTPFVTAGPDGRLGAAWDVVRGCDPQVRVSGAGFGRPDGAISAIAAPPLPVGALAFRADGKLVGLGSASRTVGTLSTVAYDPEVPVVVADPGPSTPGTPAPTPVAPGPGAGGPAGVTLKPPTVPAPVSTATPNANGTLTVTTRLNVPGAATFAIYAQASGLTARAAAAKTVLVASAKVTVKKAGKVRVTLEPKGRGLRTLRKKGRLAATLRTTFVPKTGVAPKPTTKKVTLRLRKSRARR